MNKALVKKLIPRRKKNDNKTAGGKCLLIAGSDQMWGAAILAAMSAVRAGAGYVYIYAPKGQFPICQNPDFLLIKKKLNFKVFSAVALGPGFLDHKTLIKLINQLKKEKFQNVVLDAEALNALSKMKTRPRLPSSWILTPHEGELSRLIKVTASEIRKNRTFYVQQAQQMFGCHIILKGHQSLIASDKGVYVNPTGNPSLAKAGTGDVLTGLVAALLSQGLTTQDAARLGCYIHGYVADRWITNKNDQLSLRATDLIADLPKALRSLRKG